MTNALDKFLIDGDQIDLDRLAELVEPFFQGVDKGTGNPYFKPPFRNASSKAQILIFLLAKKVAHQLNEKWIEAASVSEIVKSLPYIPEGTIKPVLSQQLKGEGLVEQDDQSKYFIPNHVLHGLNLESSSIPSTKMSTSITNKKSHSKVSTVQNTSAKLNLERKLWEQYIESLGRKGNYLERSLLVLKIAKDSGHDEGISPAEIEWFLKEKVRSPINSKNISYFLGKSSSSICDREKKGKSFFYRIMSEGEKVVEKYLVSKRGNEQP